MTPLCLSLTWRGDTINIYWFTSYSRVKLQPSRSERLRPRKANGISSGLSPSQTFGDWCSSLKTVRQRVSSPSSAFLFCSGLQCIWGHIRAFLFAFPHSLCSEIADVLNPILILISFSFLGFTPMSWMNTPSCLSDPVPTQSSDLELIPCPNQAIQISKCPKWRGGCIHQGNRNFNAWGGPLRWRLPRVEQHECSLLFQPEFPENCCFTLVSCENFFFFFSFLFLTVKVIYYKMPPGVQTERHAAQIWSVFNILHPS